MSRHVRIGRSRAPEGERQGEGKPPRAGSNPREGFERHRATAGADRAHVLERLDRAERVRRLRCTIDAAARARIDMTGPAGTN